MLMMPPYWGAAPASRAAPAASTPAAVPASTSRRVNGAPQVGTTVPASETNKAMILLLTAPLLEPCRQRRSGMRACQHLSFGQLPKAPTVRPADRWRPSPLPWRSGRCRPKGQDPVWLDQSERLVRVD